MAQSSLTAQRLRELFHYDSETGVFRRAAAGKGARVGAIVGHVNNNGYRIVVIDGIKHSAHRLAWLWVHGAWPEDDIDHINGDRLDNRLANLRDVPNVVNCENRRHGIGFSGLLGAYFHPASKLWFARIKARGKAYSLGYHRTAEQAHQAYLVAKRKHHEGCTI